MFIFKQPPGTQRETTGELESLLTDPEKVSTESALSKDTHHEACHLPAHVAAACAYCFGTSPESTLGSALAGILYALKYSLWLL